MLPKNLHTIFVLLITLLVIYISVSDVFAEGGVYVNNQKHFSFSIPPGWRSIEKSEIDRVEKLVTKETNGKYTNYSAGFHPEGEKYPSYPYILVYEQDASGELFSQVEDILSESFTSASNDYSEYILTAQMEEPYVDRKKGLVIINSSAEVKSVGKVRAVTAVFVGKDQVTSINLYAREADPIFKNKSFDNLITSFKYEDGYRYDTITSSSEYSSGIFSGVLEQVIGGVLIGGMLGIVIWFFVEIKRPMLRKHIYILMAIINLLVWIFVNVGFPLGIVVDGRYINKLIAYSLILAVFPLPLSLLLTFFLRKKRVHFIKIQIILMILFNLFYVRMVLYKLF